MEVRRVRASSCVPVHELVQATNSLKNRPTRLVAKVICVAQDDGAVQRVLGDLLRGQALDRACGTSLPINNTCSNHQRRPLHECVTFCADRHEHRRGHGTVGEVQTGGACTPTSGDDLEHQCGAANIEL